MSSTTVDKIKEWLKCENEIKELQTKLNVLKREKKQKTADLIGEMKKNNIDCFSTKDGNIQYKQKNVKKPLSQGHLMQLLLQFHEGNEEKAIELHEFFKANREEVQKEVILLK
jgi:hypothetical protein